MGIARFKELCLDVAAGDTVTGPFWAALTGTTHQPDPVVDGVPGPGDVVGEQEGMGIALCPVPEAKTVKNRVHLDVSVGSLAEVTDRGGVLGDHHEHWTVCADPVGNELCAFVREGELPAYRVFEMVVDSADPETVAKWWAAAFGVEATNELNGTVHEHWWITGVDGFPTSGPFFAMVFAPVPEPKTVKNRLHWDVYGDPADFLALGATHLWDTPHWVVLADPEGNEFCVFPG